MLKKLLLIVFVVCGSLHAMDVQREHVRALSLARKSLQDVIARQDVHGRRQMSGYTDWVSQEQKDEAAAIALGLNAPDVALAWVKGGARVADGRPMLLGVAVRSGDDEAVQALCKQGANKEDALMLAVGSGRVHLVKALVGMGANVYTGHSGWLAHAPLHLAQQHADDVQGCAAIVRYLKGYYRELRDGTLMPYRQ